MIQDCQGIFPEQKNPASPGFFFVATCYYFSNFNTILTLDPLAHLFGQVPSDLV